MTAQINLTPTAPLVKLVDTLLRTNPDATIKDCFTRQGHVVLTKTPEEAAFEEKVREIKARAFMIAKLEAQGDHRKETYK